MAINLATTISDLTLDHMDKGNLVMGQCLTAVGWVGGTVPKVPNHPSMVELSMADVAGGGIAVGSSLFGNRPIYIVRYQGFLWYNLISVVNYAAKSKELWNVPCPIIVRAIAMEGKIGPVAGSSHISLAYRMPGVKIACPRTPREYIEVWQEASTGDDPYIISEHRASFSVTEDTMYEEYESPDIVLLPLACPRQEVDKVVSKSSANISVEPLVFIKPFKNFSKVVDLVQRSKNGAIIIDDDYPDGMAKSIAYDLTIASGKKVEVMGLANKTAGFSDATDNLPPNENQIKNKIEDILKCKIY
jgi:hypothetical protein